MAVWAMFCVFQLITCFFPATLHILVSWRAFHPDLVATYLVYFELLPSTQMENLIFEYLLSVKYISRTFFFFFANNPMYFS